MEPIYIKDQEDLGNKVEKFRSAGKEKFHILADFDRTLTKKHIGGKVAPNVIAVLREGNYLTPDYSSRASALHDHYVKFEQDRLLSLAERTKKMDEWWRAHNQLLVECGLNLAVIRQAVSNIQILLREGAREMIATLDRKSIPLVIMSAAPAPMIREYLQQQECLLDSVHVIGNEFIFDSSGAVQGMKDPIIHSLNKHETIVSNFPVFETIEHRTNVLLLGDKIEDLGMIEGFVYQNLITIGFYNYEDDQRLEAFKRAFDIVLTGDQDMRYVFDLTKKIINE